MNRVYLGALAALVAAAGCGDDDGGAGMTPEPRGIFAPEGLPDVIVPELDAGDMMPEPPPDDDDTDAATDSGMAMMDSGMMDAGMMLVDGGVDAGPVELYVVGGVRTNVPHLIFVDQGTSNVKLVSAFFRRVSTPSFESILIHGEYENRSSVRQCIPLVDMFVGAYEVLAVAEANMHYEEVLGTVACIEPGGRSVFRAIENDIPATLLEDADALTYDFDVLERDYPPHPDTPTLVTAERYEREGTWGFTGRILSRSMPIYNLAIDFYAKDARGLVVDDTSAYPRDLDTITPNTVVEYTSFRYLYHTEQPDGFISVMSFLEGNDPTPNSSVVPVGVPLSPEQERNGQARSRSTRLRELREQLR